MIRAYNLRKIVFTILTTVFVFLSLGPSKAKANFIEVGASGSYKRSNIGENAYDESQSLTGSLSYYFDESSAIELSYTDGKNRRMIGENQADGQLTNMTYKMMGLDFVLTIGPREATLRPYVKVGAVYILEKRITSQTWLNNVVFPGTPIEDPPALVPSAGIGFKLTLTKEWSLKVGAEAWTSRPLSQTPVTIDYSGRVGLTWLF
ncbi:MAG: outer membrane beta-barrel protein [Deltaproteobacteria bacterium]|nr:outer membrane beta-barrel protein [Deltaproteobacteria bacterium]